MKPVLLICLLIAFALAVAGCRGAGAAPATTPGSDQHVSATNDGNDQSSLAPVADCSDWPGNTGGAPLTYSDADRDWLQFRGDRALTGRSAVVGNGECLELFATAEFSRRLSWVVAELNGSASSTTIDLPDEDFGPFDALSIVNPPPEYLVPVSGWFAPGQRPLGARFGNLTDAYDGPERVTCSDIDHDFDFSDFGTYGSCALSSFDGSDWVERWRTTLPTLEGDAFSAAYVFGDFDNDGRKDVAIRTWYGFQLLVLDTGERWGEGLFTPFPQHPLNYATGPEDPDCAPGIPEPCFVPWDQRPQPTSSGRGYGWFGARDIDSDGVPEFIVMGVAEQFISVLGWTDGRLDEVWKHTFEELYHPKGWITQHTPPRDPVLDLDGDGVMEIITNVYSEANDGLWHVLVFDSTTGEIKLDVPDAYVVDSIVLTPDAPPALFIAEGVGAAVDAPGRLRLSTYRDGKLTDVWTLADSNLETRAILEFPEYSDADGNLNPVLQFVGADASESTPAMFVTRGNGALSVWRALPRATGAETVASFPTPNARAVDADLHSGRLRLLVEVDHRPGDSITAVGADLHVGSSRSQPPPISPPLVTTGSDGATLVIVQTSMNELTSFRVDTSTGSLDRFATYSGRGMWNYLTFGANEISQVMEVPALEGALLADLAGDGGTQLVVAVPGGIAAYHLDGTMLWLSDLGVSGGIGFGDRPHIAFWFAGQFIEAGREDIAVFIVRGRRAELRLLDGRDGSEIWRLEDGPVTCLATSNWGAATGAGWDAVADIDGDGLDELLLTPFREFLAISMDDLSFPITRQAYGCETPGTDIFPVHPRSLPVPVPVVVRHPGGDVIVYSRHPQVLGVTDLQGDRIWHRAWEPETDSSELGYRAVMQGIGDLDGDGTLEIVAPGYCDGGEELRVFDLATGNPRWSIRAPETCQGHATRALITADFDGDGRDEVLLTNSGALQIIEFDQPTSRLRTVWQVESGSWFFSTPAISALDESGTIAVFAVTGEGRLVIYAAAGTN